MSAPTGKKPGRKKIKGTAKEQFIKNGQRLPRDPNAPAPKIGAYMFFAQQERKNMARMGLDFQSAGTAIGKAWHELGEEGKKPFEEAAAKDAARFAKEMAAYKPSAKFVEELEAAKKKAKHQPRLKDDPAAPRKPHSAYLFFTAEARAALAKDVRHKDKSITELSVVMGQQWSALPDLAKDRFVHMAEADKVRYETELKKYKPTPAWLEAKEYLEARRANAHALFEAAERKKNGPAPHAKAAERAAERNKEKKAAALYAQQKKVATAHKAAVATYQKAAKTKTRLEAEEAKAKVKLLLLEAKLKTAEDELEKLGVKKRKTSDNPPSRPPTSRPQPPAAQLLELGEDD